MYFSTAELNDLYRLQRQNSVLAQIRRLVDATLRYYDFRDIKETDDGFTFRDNRYRAPSHGHGKVSIKLDDAEIGNEAPTDSMLVGGLITVLSQSAGGEAIVTGGMISANQYVVQFVPKPSMSHFVTGRLVRLSITHEPMQHDPCDNEALMELNALLEDVEPIEDQFENLTIHPCTHYMPLLATTVDVPSPLLPRLTTYGYYGWSDSEWYTYQKTPDLRDDPRVDQLDRLIYSVLGLKWRIWIGRHDSPVSESARYYVITDDSGKYGVQVDERLFLQDVRIVKVTWTNPPFEVNSISEVPNFLVFNSEELRNRID